MGDLQRGRLNNTTLARFEFTPAVDPGRSHDLCRILGRLFKAGKQNEGDLAQYCDRSIWRPDWKDNVQWLIDLGHVKTESTGRGHARFLELTDQGMKWAEEAYAELPEDDFEKRHENWEKAGGVYSGLKEPRRPKAQAARS